MMYGSGRERDEKPGTMIPATNPAPGWYAISQRPRLLRWWTGLAWSDALVARGSSIDAHQTTTALLRRGRMVATGIWIVAGLWVGMAVMMALTGGYGPMPFLAPVAFIIGGIFMESRVATYRRLLAPDAPPPFGLAPLR
ncbi:hypothetical protein [Microbacterium sp. NPDC087665]|uniref:hypothetical protein n=1 Tax=Microbacterium sp. NPDC087665 TaxID=3364194 RepID=UPI003822C538